MSLSSIHKWLLTELHFCRSTQAIIVIGEFMIAMAMLCSKNSISHPTPYILAPYSLHFFFSETYWLNINALFGLRT